MEPSTWVEVSSAALEANLRAVQAHAGVPVCAVVKANAYGHGLGAARALAGAGAAMLAVTRLEEARAVRDAGIDTPLLLLLPPPDVGAAVKLGCAVPVGSMDDIERLPPDARVHLKVDTGMGRLGIRPEHALGAATRIAERASLEGVWTHFAAAASDGGRRQLERFLAVRETLRNAGIACMFHAANSEAALARPEALLDLVRVGTLLYGQNPPGARASFALRETFTWYARVASIRRVGPGATVGYGSEWRAAHPTRLATIPVGYADGFTAEPFARTETFGEALRVSARIAAVAAGRRASPRAVFFDGRRAPVVGRVAMQAMTVSLEGLDDVGVGAVATLAGRRLLVSPLIERVYT